MKKFLFTALTAFFCASAFAQDAATPSVSEEMFTINNLWILIGTILVFIMHPGFAMLEAGLTRAKNSVNVLCKNVTGVAMGLVLYMIVGFGLMYPGEDWLLGSFLGFTQFGISAPEGAAILYNGGKYTYWTDFIFQAMFCATSVTIVSGAVAERIKLSAFLLFAAVMIAFVYPIIGSWGWGGGWLADLGFYDLAGSTFVHSVGGWAALVCVLILGPRIGKYVNGKAYAIPGHNMGFATLGVFLLFFGWFGFNGASVFSADPMGVSYVFVTTALGAATGLISAMATSWIIQKKPDLSMILNGCLAGLVGITAGADVFSVTEACVVGFIAGIIVVFAVYAFDKLKIDDPVGALSVHLVCGVWGTLAVGIFVEDKSLLVQLVGVLSVGLATIVSAFTIFYSIKKIMGVRVSEREELCGLDLSEHGMEGYNGFQIFSNQ